MQLLKMKLINFRRFSGEHRIELSDPMIALVGPNEAGKTSILRALELIGNDEAPSPADRTRRAQDPAQISVLYRLESDDLTALAGVPAGSEVTHCWVTWTEGSDETEWDVRPYPERPRDLRHAVQGSLGTIENDPDLRDAVDAPDDDLTWSEDLVDEVRESLALDQETIAATYLDDVRLLAQRLRSIPVAQLFQQESGGDGILNENPTPIDPVAQDRLDGRQAIANQLEQLVEEESLPTPADRAIGVLAQRLPTISLFSAEDRDLKSDYQLAAIAESLHPALGNLLALAEIDIQEVARHESLDDKGYVERIFETGNARLRERFLAAWSQSEVFPRLLPPHDGVLRVMLAAQGGDGYTRPSDRSDGLMWFVALHSFLVRHGDTHPIVLVDEIETHLHYDAQVDLINLLMRESFADKVIYTTHSVGALPPDLGSGIRAVVPDSDKEPSAIRNSYWAIAPEEEPKIGDAPLLFAMGARMLPLAVPRAAVLTEGPSDAILLPSLFREALDSERLEFRILPGLAELGKARVGEADRLAGRVVFLVDGDQAGRSRRQMLVDKGVDASRIFTLGALGEGVTLEDLVDADSFAKAVNLEFETWAYSSRRFDPDEIPDVGRWRWLEELARDEGIDISSMSKARLAQRLADARRNPESDLGSLSILRDNLSKAFSNLHHELLRELGVTGA